MEFVYELVSTQDLSKIERMLIACRDEDFYCIRYNGVVKINRNIPKPATVAKIVGAMWKIDQPLDEVKNKLMDDLYQRLKLITGENAAAQFCRAWHEAVQEKMDAADKRAAIEWLQERNIADELDVIGNSYHPGIVKALWSRTTSIDAIFLYGYQIGMEAARAVGQS